MKKKKLPYKTAKQENKENAMNILDQIITATYTRDLGLDEKEYLEKIGFKDKKITEREAVRTSILNVLNEMTKVIFSMERNIDAIDEVFRKIILSNGITEVESKEEYEKREKENGKEE